MVRTKAKTLLHDRVSKSVGTILIVVVKVLNALLAIA